MIWRSVVQTGWDSHVTFIPESGSVVSKGRFRWAGRALADVAWRGMAWRWWGVRCGVVRCVGAWKKEVGVRVVGEGEGVGERREERGERGEERGEKVNKRVRERECEAWVA